MLSGQADATGYELVRAYWQKQHTGADFEQFWRKSLHDGWIDGTTFQPKTVSAKAASAPSESKPADANAIELNIRRDPTIWDGQFSNNGWLQELPKPMSKLTWDNAVQVGPKMAGRLHLASKDVVELELNGKKIQGAVWIQAGHPDNSITITLGYGRKRAGRVGTGARLRRLPTPHQHCPVDSPAESRSARPARPTNWPPRKACSRWTRPMASIAPWSAKPASRNTRKSPDSRKEEEVPQGLTLYPRYEYEKEQYAWGMAIDLNRCVGCNNCIIACQSENNIAVVGKEQTLLGRHMHWMRVDAYYQGDRDNPKAFFQPVPCMHCENAPCEVVCPVGATSHTQRRPERHGLQPLRGHALLFEQLPVQGPPLQFPALPGLGHAAATR